MLKSLVLKNFTVFPEAELRFGAHLNVIVGENGTGPLDLALAHVRHQRGVCFREHHLDLLDAVL